MPGEETSPRYGTPISYALWALFFVGLGGVHRIYLGHYGTGVLWLLTFGLFGVGQFVDLFRMDHLVEKANVREGYLPHPRWRHLAAPNADGRRVGGANGDRPTDPGTRERTMRALLREAEKRDGAISVTQGVAATGLPFEKVEEILGEMVTSGYVDVDNAPESGVVLYRFTELD